MKKRSLILIFVFGAVLLLLVFAGAFFIFYWFGVKNPDVSGSEADGTVVHKEYMTPFEDCSIKEHVSGDGYSCVSKKKAATTLIFTNLDRCQKFVSCRQIGGMYCETRIDPKFQKCVDCVKNCSDNEFGCSDKCVNSPVEKTN